MGQPATTAADGRRVSSRRRWLWLVLIVVSIAAFTVGVLGLIGAGPVSVASANPGKPQPTSAEFSVAAPPTVPTGAAQPPADCTALAGGCSVPRPCHAAPSPDHLVINRLCIDAAIGVLTDNKDELDPPSDVHAVGLWTQGQPLATNGTTGPSGATLIGGHIDNVHQGDGALHPLYLSQPGDLAITEDAAGVTQEWQLVALQEPRKGSLAQQAPSDGTAGCIDISPNPHATEASPDYVRALNWCTAFAGRTQAERTLVVVTCGGAFDRAALSYESNIIAVYVPVTGSSSVTFQATGSVGGLRKISPVGLAVAVSRSAGRSSTA